MNTLNLNGENKSLIGVNFISENNNIYNDINAIIIKTETSEDVVYGKIFQIEYGYKNGEEGESAFYLTTCLSNINIIFEVKISDSKTTKEFVEYVPSEPTGMTRPVYDELGNYLGEEQQYRSYDVYCDVITSYSRIVSGTINKNSRYQEDVYEEFFNTENFARYNVTVFGDTHLVVSEEYPHELVGGRYEENVETFWAM